MFGVRSFGDKGSFSLEAMLVFVGVALFWIAVFSIISPQLKEMQELVVEQELMGECLKVTNTVDTLATYGAETIYISLTPYFKQSMERGVFFCQEHSGCRCDDKGQSPQSGCSKTIWAVKTNKTGVGITNRVNCTTHVAGWIDLIMDNREVYDCKEAETSNRRWNMTIKFGTYFEKSLEDPEKSARNCW